VAVKDRHLFLQICYPNNKFLFIIWFNQEIALMELDYGILHNRKTAGTALKEAIQQQKLHLPKVNFFGHAMTFPLFVKKYPQAKAIFFIREPIARFVSGFYSRKRQGQPRYHYPWTPQEQKAFTRFNTPNDLGEALSSFNPFHRYAAISAMQSIHHVRHTYLTFLGSLDFLKKQIMRIAFIGHQSDCL
jgi:Sulfotransferase family